jgi:hypothetical protein
VGVWRLAAATEDHSERKSTVRFFPDGTFKETERGLPTHRGRWWIDAEGQGHGDFRVEMAGPVKAEWLYPLPWHQRRLPQDPLVWLLLVAIVALSVLGTMLPGGLYGHLADSATTRALDSAGPSAAAIAAEQSAPAAGECLSVYPMELHDEPPEDWRDSTVACDSTNANVRIVDVFMGGQTVPKCDTDATGCMRFVDAGQTFHFNAIPQLGQCFFGWRWDSGGYSWPIRPMRCGTEPPDWVLSPSEEWAAEHGTTVSDGHLTEWTTEAVLAADGTCPEGMSYWTVDFSETETTKVCGSGKPVDAAE